MFYSLQGVVGEPGPKGEQVGPGIGLLRSVCLTGANVFHQQGAWADLLVWVDCGGSKGFIYLF